MQLKISYSVHQNLNVKANNDRSFDFTLPAGQQPGMAPPPQAAPQVGLPTLPSVISLCGCSTSTACVAAHPISQVDLSADTVHVLVVYCHAIMRQVGTTQD